MAETAEGLRSAFERRNFPIGDDDVLEKCAWAAAAAGCGEHGLAPTRPAIRPRAGVEACRVLGRSAEKLVDLWDLHAMRTSDSEVTRAAIETLVSDEKVPPAPRLPPRCAPWAARGHRVPPRCPGPLSVK